MVQPDENIYRSIIALNKQNDPNWNMIVTWLKDSYLREGMGVVELDNAETVRLMQGQVRQLRSLIHFINNAEELLSRDIEARKKASVQ